MGHDGVKSQQADYARRLQGHDGVPGKLYYGK